MNHVWTEEELQQKFATKDMKFVPITTSDKIANIAMNTLYKTFNFITGYREVNPPTSAIEWRLIVLESFAGVPGFLAAGFRHFHSLRTLKRDHGAIFTFLEEAENERSESDPHTLTPQFYLLTYTKCCHLPGCTCSRA